MNDLNRFLTDSFQYRLKSIASKKSSDRFEIALQNYFALFFDEFSNIKSAHKVDSFKKITSSTKPQLYDWIDCVYEGLKTELNFYKNLFNDLIYTYHLFIRGKHYQATLHIFDVLEKYDMTDASEAGELGIYYKGRAIRVGDVTTDDTFYYHIPFDMRFLVGNQRFSYSGQPILYIGSSILDVLYELRCNLNRYKKIAIASIGYDSLIEMSINSTTKKRFEPIKIYDVTNRIQKLINEVLINLVNQGGGIPECDDTNFAPNLNDLKKDFKKFILTQICTFKRKYKNTFIEEYIPAQILTEALKINGYNGIKFPSTRFDKKKIINKSILYPSVVQENLALFVKYSKTNRYDDEIMKYFIVNPLDETKAISKTVADYKKEIVQFQKDIILGCYHIPRLAKSFQNASMNLNKVHSCEDNLEIAGKPYFDWDYARLELMAQSGYLAEIKNQLKYFNNGQQITFPIK